MLRKVQVVSFISLAVLFSLPAFCQLETGTFTGRVNDPSGAVVPNATVGVVNTDTNFTSETKTNNEGLYRIPSMQAGNYRMTVAAPGFKQSVHDGLELHVAEVQEVNVVVELGVATERSKSRARLRSCRRRLRPPADAGGSVTCSSCRFISDTWNDVSI